MTEFKQVRLITGTPIAYERVVGYCNCDTHKGYLTKNLIDNHECIAKKCPFLHKHNEEYWHQQEARQRSHEKKKNRIKSIKKFAKLQQELEEAFFEECKAAAKQIAEEMDYDITITRVRHDNGDLNCDYIVFYLSDKKYDDFAKYYPLALELSREYSKSFKLRRVRTIEGKLAMAKDIIKT